jgi:hypothetical protein
MSDPLRLHPLGEHAALVRDRLSSLTGAEVVDELAQAELVVMTPEDLTELIEDAAATAAYHRAQVRSICPSASSTGWLPVRTPSGCGASVADTRCASLCSDLNGRFIRLAPRADCLAA